MAVRGLLELSLGTLPHSETEWEAAGTPLAAVALAVVSVLAVQAALRLRLPVLPVVFVLAAAVEARAILQLAMVVPAGRVLRS